MSPTSSFLSSIRHAHRRSPTSPTSSLLSSQPRPLTSLDVALDIAGIARCHRCRSMSLDVARCHSMTAVPTIVDRRGYRLFFPSSMTSLFLSRVRNLRRGPSVRGHSACCRVHATFREYRSRFHRVCSARDCVILTHARSERSCPAVFLMGR